MARMWVTVGGSPGISNGCGAVSRCGDLGEAAAADVPVTCIPPSATCLFPWDLSGLLCNCVHLPQLAGPCCAHHTGATPPCPAAQTEWGGEGQLGGTAVPVTPQGSPRDAGQWGHQAGQVEGPGAAIAADELTTITACCTLILVLLFQGSGQGVTITAIPLPQGHTLTARLYP